MTRQLEIEAANETISRTVAECLDKHYPGHAWAVRADVETGLVHVYNLRLSGQWGFILKIDALATDPDLKLVMRAGGEMLERYNLSRAYAKEHEYAAVHFDYKGDAIQYGQ